MEKSSSQKRPLTRLSRNSSLRRTDLSALAVSEKKYVQNPRSSRWPQRTLDVENVRALRKTAALRAGKKKTSLLIS